MAMVSMDDETVKTLLKVASTVGKSCSEVVDQAIQKATEEKLKEISEGK